MQDIPKTIKEHRKYVRRIRKEAGYKGGKAPHEKRGLQCLPPERRKEISESGVEARRVKRLARLEAEGPNDKKASASTE